MPRCVARVNTVSDTYSIRQNPKHERRAQERSKSNFGQLFKENLIQPVSNYSSYINFTSRGNFQTLTPARTIWVN